ncbi:MAG: hypothetical protein QOC81_1396 [Thermoanaerobaculia bacterium]|nr:hypothetical protein [Thermoanaerobaculia bacterium]
MKASGVALIALLVVASAYAQSNCPSGGTILSIPSSVTGQITIGSCKQGSEYHDIYHIPNLLSGRQLRFVVTKTSLPDLHFEITYVANLNIVDIYNKYEFSKSTITADIEVPVSGQINIFVAGATSFSTGGYTLSVSDLSAAGGAKQIVPIVGHVAGVGGSAFRSDLKLYNPTSSTITGRLVFTNRGQSETQQDTSIPYNIPPNGITFFQDVYAVAFPGVGGAARLSIVPDGSTAPIVDSSTYTALSDGGELAQSPTVLTPASFMTGVQVAALGKGGERTNVFVITGSQDVTIYWKYRDATGVQHAAPAQTYAHDATHQLSVSDLLGLTPGPNGSLEANVVIGSARLALSPVNNVSNQGRWLDFQRVP